MRPIISILSSFFWSSFFLTKSEIQNENLELGKFMFMVTHVHKTFQRSGRSWDAARCEEDGGWRTQVGPPNTNMAKVHVHVERMKNLTESLRRATQPSGSIQTACPSSRGAVHRPNEGISCCADLHLKRRAEIWRKRRARGLVRSTTTPNRKSF